MPTALDKLIYIIVHMTWFELPLVLTFTAIASWRLATVLSKHDARGQEAKLARQVAAFYTAVTFILVSVAHILG